MKKLYLFISFFVSAIIVFAQSTSNCPVVVGLDSVSCPTSEIHVPVHLNSIFKRTTSYAKSTIPHAPEPTVGFLQNLTFSSLDDRFANIATNIGFPFCFFGNTYTKCVISTNGFITFDVAAAGTPSTPYNPVPIPNNGAPNNSVYGVYTDLQLNSATDIKYKTIGVYPCRKFVVAFVNVGFYGNLANAAFKTTFQIILYEGSNNIEVHITKKNGSASPAIGSVCGIENTGGTGSGTNGSQFATGWNNTNFTVTAANPQARLFAPSGTIFNTVFIYPIDNGITATVPVDTITFAGTSVDSMIHLSGPFPKCYVAKYQTCNVGYNVAGTYSPKPYFIGDTICIEQDSLDIALNAVDNSCYHSCNGSITITTLNDTVPPFYYTVSNYLTGDTLINDSAFTTPFTINNLCVGTYNICLTTAGGCFICDTISIAEPDTLISFVSSHTNVLCNPQSTGGFLVNTIGGTQNYIYSSQPSYSPTLNLATSVATYNNVAANNYIITVTDANGCTDTAMVTITQPTVPLAIAINTQTNILCFGNSSGSVSVVGSGGTAPYQFKNGVLGTYANASNFSGLAAGNYTIFIKDANGCTSSINVSLTQPATALTIGTSQQDVDCFSNATGSITLVGNGGTTAYTYHCGTTTNTTGVFNGLIAGTYSCNVEDNNGCVSAANITITQPTAALNGVITSQTNVLCFGGNNANVVITGSGGTTTYSFDITTGVNAAIIPTITSNSATFSTLLMGVSNVIITDANGCTKTVNVTITQPTVQVVNLDSNIAVDCFGTATGKLCVSGSGGVSPYDFTATNPAGYTNTVNNVANNCFQNILTNTYNVVITDANNCTAQQQYLVTEPIAALSFNILSVDSVSCHSGSDGEINLIAAGGTSPYTYNVTPFANYQTTLPLQGIAAGFHQITVKDFNGCTVSDTATIHEPLLALAFIVDSVHNALCNGDNNGCIFTHAIAGTGTPSYSFSTSSNGPFASNSSLCGLAANNYTVYIKDAHNCITSLTAIVTQPLPLNVVLTTDSANCFGSTDGCALMLATGGTTPYQYFWLGNAVATTNSICGLAASSGNLYKTIDLLGCIDSGNFDIEEPNLMELSLPDTINLCTNTPVTVIASTIGGTLDYIYHWLHDTTLINDTVLITPPNGGINKYKVFVTDAYGCLSNKDSVIIIVRPSPVPLFTATDTAGCVEFCTTFIDNSTISATYGDFLVYHNWEFGDGFTANSLQPQHCYENAGNYTVCLNLESNRGCRKKVCKTSYISVYPIPENDFTYSPQEVDLLQPEITFKNEHLPFCTYTWNYGDGLSDTTTNASFFTLHNYADTGTYTIQLITTSLFGCVDTTEHTLIVNPFFSFYIPTAFTPNDDDHNQYFELKGQNFKEFEMQIFNRNGELIFKQNKLGQSNCWDGGIAPSGVYNWQVIVTDPKGKRVMKNGTVTLIR